MAAGAAETPPRDTDTDLARSLVVLGDEAFARGDLATAQQRYERARAAAPGDAAPELGLGRVALAQSRLDDAQGHFEAARRKDPSSAEPLVRLGEVAMRRKQPEVARDRLREALDLDRWQPEAHARLRLITGPARGLAEASPDEVIGLADRHPYDLRAQAQAGRLEAERGLVESAVARFEWVLTLADLNPRIANSVMEDLAALEPAWAGRVLIPVHCWADQTVGPAMGWGFRLRWILRDVSESLDDVLGVRFVPASMQRFESGAGHGLDAIEGARMRAAPTPPAGIVATFTERALPPRSPGALGHAAFLGRTLVVRLEPGARESRTLLHEMLHLYGAIHVSDRVDSLMNPSGTAREIDPYNQGIVRTTRRRRFGRGIESDVLARIDIGLTTEAYVAALNANLEFRRLGIHEALDASQDSRFDRRRRVDKVTKLDSNLADVCEFVHVLMYRLGRLVQAQYLLELAADLYGPDTPEGRDADARAKALRQVLIERYGDGG